MFCLITYDLKKVKNYPKLYECLHAWKAQRLLESVWIAQLVGPCEAVRQALMYFIDGDDAIAVVELKPGLDWATMRCQQGGVAMLTAIERKAAA